MSRYLFHLIYLRFSKYDFYTIERLNRRTQEQLGIPVPPILINPLNKIMERIRQDHLNEEDAWKLFNEYINDEFK